MKSGTSESLHILPLAMAMFTATLYAVASNVVSYYAEYTRKTGTEISRGKQIAIDGGAFCTYMIGGLIATVAYSMGDPVPLLQGTLVATNLLMNMCFQIALGISSYTKSMRVGTLLCFFVMIFQLGFVGPEARGNDVDVLSFFSKRSAIIWFFIEGALLILSAIVVYRTIRHPTGSPIKILGWSLLVGVLGSATDNVASTFGVMSFWVLFVSFTGYAVVSVVTLLLSAKAPGVCDANTYVPLQLVVQLCLNMVTGVCVWKDLDRMDGKPLPPYFVTFVIIILSVYVASPSADLVESLLRWYIFRNTKLSEERAPSTFGKAVLALLASWHKLRTEPCKESEDDARKSLTHALSVGTERGRLTSQDMVELAVDLYGACGSFGCSLTFLKWLDKNAYFRLYLAWDPAFRDNLLAVLPSHERDRLRSSFMQVAEMSARQNLV